MTRLNIGMLIYFVVMNNTIKILIRESANVIIRDYNTIWKLAVCV